MSKKDSAFSSHPNMHRPEKIRTSCPSFNEPVHDKDGEAEERPCLSVNQMRDRLSSTNLRSGGTVASKAYELGRRYRVDPHELLQRAVVRSLGQRTRRPDLPAEVFLAQLMRSVGSSIARARARARDREDDLRYYVAEQSAGFWIGLSADEVLQMEADQRFYSNLLDEVANGAALLVQLIDGIGMGLRGAELAAFLTINQAELASRRRTLKRRAQAIARREKLLRDNETTTEGGDNA